MSRKTRFHVDVVGRGRDDDHDGEDDSDAKTVDKNNHIDDRDQDDRHNHGVPGAVGDPVAAPLDLEEEGDDGVEEENEDEKENNEEINLAKGNHA